MPPFRLYSPDGDASGGSSGADSGAGGQGEGAGSASEQGDSSTRLAELEAAQAQLTAERAELAARKAELEARLAEREREIEEARQKQTEAAGVHLAERERIQQERDALAATATEKGAKLTELEARVQAYEAREAARVAELVKANDDRIAALPEALRDLVPVELRSSPDALANWLNRAGPKLQVAAGTEVNANPGARTAPPTADERRIAERMGLDLSQPENLAYLRSNASRLNRQPPPTA